MIFRDCCQWPGALAPHGLPHPSLLAKVLLIKPLKFHSPCLFFRRVQGQIFKEERNNDYGVYSENNVAVAEVVDQNTNYEQSESQAPGPVYDYENWEDDYDKMYDKMD